MPDLTTAQEKAFEFVQETVKQVITLSTGIIALTITFVKDFIGEGAPHGAEVLLAVAWLFYILSVICGVWTLLSVTGSLNEGGTDVFSSNIILPAIPHVLTFVIGLGLTVAASWWAL